MLNSTEKLEILYLLLLCIVSYAILYGLQGSSPITVCAMMAMSLAVLQWFFTVVLKTKEVVLIESYSIYIVDFSKLPVLNYIQFMVYWLLCGSFFEFLQLDTTTTTSQFVCMMCPLVLINILDKKLIKKCPIIKL